MLQNNTKFYLRGIISQTMTVGGTFNISNDLELQLPVDTNGETVSIVFRSERQLERMTVTISQGVCTVVSRGIEQRGGGNSSTLQRTWTEGVLGYITALDFDMMDIDGVSNEISANNTFTGDNNFKKVTFNNTTEAGLEVNSLTTTERLALTPVNGAIVYDETLGDFYTYKGGAWAVIDTGTSTPNMSETINGTGEIATASERGNATSVGGTGARLLVSNDALVKTSSGASDENKVPVLDNEGKLNDFVDINNADTTTAGIVERTTLNESLAKTDTTKYVSPVHIGMMITDFFGIVPGTDNTYASALTERSTTSTAYTKIKEVQVNRDGTYRASFENRSDGNFSQSYARVYKNGTAVSPEFETSGTTYVERTYDIDVVSGDLVQIYTRSGQLSVNSFVRNYELKYNIDVTSSKELLSGAGVINID